MQSRASRHRALRDSLQAEVVARDVALEERDPSLLNLPIPIPDIPIPIVKDVLTLVVAGKTVTTTSTKATTAASTPTHTTASPGTSTSATSGNGSGSGNGGDSGGSSSGGSSGGSNGGSSGGSNGGSSDPGGSSSSSGSSSSGSSSGSDDSSGSSSGSGDSGSSGSDSSGSSAGSSNPGGSSNSTSPSGSPGDSSSNASASGGPGGENTDNTSTGGVRAAAAAAQTPVVNFASDVSRPTGSTTFVVTGGKTVPVIGTVTYSNGLPTGTPNSPGGADGPGSTGSGGTSNPGSKGGLPTYALVLIGVMGTLVLLVLIVLGMRRRAVAKRAARRTWWNAAPASSDSWSAADSGDATAGAGSATRSIRSSFGTTFDHSEFSITFDDNVPVPEVPPMAEIRGGPGIVPKGDSSMSGNGQPLSPISPISPNSPSLPMPLLVSIANSNIFSDANRRTSAGSNLSAASAQYVSYERDGSTNNHLMTPEASTPMSVRPFSPSESFAFPAPPREHRSGDWSSTFATSPTATEIPPTPTVPRLSAIVPPQIIESLAPSLPPTTAVPATAVPENPFADAFSVAVATPPSPSRASAEFDAVETIWRPFEQTLQDEITVYAGDKVKVLAVYDDGWAMIERVGLGKGKGKAVDGNASVGLIPIDCMRKAEESVSSFLSAKRVSSVDATGYTAMAI